MQNMQKKKKSYWWVTVAFFVWFIINIRVSLGIGSTFERAIDGLVGIAFLAVAVFFALDFFQLIERKDEQGDQ